MSKTATPGLEQAEWTIRQLGEIELAAGGDELDLDIMHGVILETDNRDAIRALGPFLMEKVRIVPATPSPTPAGGEVRALIERCLGDAAMLEQSDVFQGPLSAIASLRDAAAAIASLAPAEAAQAGEAIGWKLVPVEPTDEMIDAGDDAMPLPEHYLRNTYRAMVAAAPTYPVAASTPSREEVPTDEQVLGWVTVRVEDTGDGLIIHADDAAEWKLEHEQNYEGYFLPDGRYRLKIAAALKAAGPSAQQRVSEEMVERLQGIRALAQDILDTGHDRAVIGNAMSIRDHADTLLSALSSANGERSS